MAEARPIETEVKIEVASADEARSGLRRLGAERIQERVFEDNVLFDTRARRLAKAGEALRVRTVGPRAVLTFKGPAPVRAAGLKSRTEMEVDVSDGARLVEMLAALGFAPRFRYQKYRETWRWGGCEIVVDETPMGTFLEIEGAEGDIHRAAEALGHGRSAYIAESYPSLYRARGGRGDMLFPKAATP